MVKLSKNTISNGLGIKDKREQELFKIAHIALLNNKTVSESIKEIVSKVSDPIEIAFTSFALMDLKLRLEKGQGV